MADVLCPICGFYHYFRNFSHRTCVKLTALGEGFLERKIKDDEARETAGLIVWKAEAAIEQLKRQTSIEETIDESGCYLSDYHSMMRSG